MSAELELYYFTQSFYSQKKGSPAYQIQVYLSLLEKNLPFKQHLIFIHLRDQNADWYLRLNPNGQVPVLKDGDDVIVESEEIINYIDGKTDSGILTPSLPYPDEGINQTRSKSLLSGPRLVPDVNTPHGQRVSEIRKWLLDVPVETVTYGILLNPAVRVKETKFPQMFLNLITREKYAKSLKVSIADFEARIKADPSLNEAFTKKIEMYQWKLDNVFDENNVRKILSELHQTFDKIEQELEKSRKESGVEEVWLCGTHFTAVDVVMACLFNRLDLCGLDDEYFALSKRPLVFKYHERLFDRPSVKQFLVDCSMDRSIKLMKLRTMKTCVKRALKIAIVVGVAAGVAYGVKKYISSKQ